MLLSKLCNYEHENICAAFVIKLAQKILKNDMHFFCRMFLNNDEVTFSLLLAPFLRKYLTET